jgi:2-polyprenyl-3-methyl-5-hydroxy-6-metoxy-1,4-benzoquinol methylase
MKDSITLSNSTVELINFIRESITQKYVETEMKFLELTWKKQYNIIKDESWPECNTYRDFEYLPDNIKEECITLHQFSPEFWIDSITKEMNAKYQYNVSFSGGYVRSFFDEYPEIIKGKKIIDFGCNVGHWSIFCSMQNCLNIIGIDARLENIKIAKAIQQDLNISKQSLHFAQSNIHNYQQVKDLCFDRETVLLLGIMYHVHDHYNILKSVCGPTVKNIVIETDEALEILDLPEPLIHWKYESTVDLQMGVDEGQDTILVGFPNTSWFDLAMKGLGFERVAFKRGVGSSSSHLKTEQFKEIRSVYLYKKI